MSCDPSHSFAPFGFLAMLVVGLLALAMVPGCSEPAVSAAPATQPAGGLPGVAVVELFTSEGCSSCPPADGVLADLAAAARREGTNTIALSFHVDYWDHLGWRDPYSSRDYSDRQQAYTNAERGRQTYTPQMIVNGGKPFVGSDAVLARRAVADALRAPAAAGVSLHVDAARAGEVTVSCRVMGAPAGAVLNVAVAERDLASSVRRGENAGQTLRHQNVVRAIKTVAIDASNAVSLKLRVPEGVDLKKSAIVGYVQEPKTLHILGAAQVDVNAEMK